MAALPCARVPLALAATAGLLPAFFCLEHRIVLLFIGLGRWRGVRRWAAKEKPKGRRQRATTWNGRNMGVAGGRLGGGRLFPHLRGANNACRPGGVPRNGGRGRLLQPYHAASLRSRLQARRRKRRERRLPGGLTSASLACCGGEMKSGRAARENRA